MDVIYCNHRFYSTSGREIDDLSKVEKGTLYGDMVNYSNIAGLGFNIRTKILQMDYPLDYPLDASDVVSSRYVITENPTDWSEKTLNLRITQEDEVLHLDRFHHFFKAVKVSGPGLLTIYSDYDFDLKICGKSIITVVRT
jgi:hypothetical protein